VNASPEQCPSPTNTTPLVGRIILVRHGPTAWSRSGQHTSHTDLPLDEEGRHAALGLARRLAALGIIFALTSPLRRAHETARLAGFPDAHVCGDLVEWDYGQYEGRTTLDIQRERPGWSIFRDGCPGGEDVSAVERRCQRVLDALNVDPEAEGAVALFAHGHLLRVLGASYLGLGGAAGEKLALDTASVSILGFERQTPILRAWNG
jgi:broad specificity phosphatase PhoE